MIVVSEAMGVVGREVVRALEGTGIMVRMGVRQPNEAKGMEAPDREVVRFDLNDPDSMRYALTSARHLCLLTPISDRAVELATRAIDIAKQAGVEHIVFQSTLGVTMDIQCRFLQWHRMIEDYLVATNIHFTILRANEFMETLIALSGDTLQRDNVIDVPLGDARVSFLAARDFGTVSAECMASTGHVNKVYTLTGPAAISLNEFARALGTAAGRGIDYIESALDTTRRHLAAMNISEWLIDGYLELFAFYRTGGADMVTNDVERITSLAPLDVWTWADLHKGEFRAAA